MHKRDPTYATCAFLLLLLLTPVSPQCRQGTPDECRKAGYVTGSHVVGSGFDITKLSSVEKVPIKRDGVLTLSAASQCTLCENPLLEGKPLQRLPLVMTDWKVNVSCQQKVQHSVHQSALSVAEALTELRVKNDWRNELDVKLNLTPMTQWALAGSHHEWPESCRRKNSQNQFIFLIHHFTCSYYKVQVSKVVSKEFEDEVQHLPEKYDSSSNSEYLKFIESYGTHIGTEVDLGAHIRYLTAVPVCLAVLEDTSVSEISRCLAILIGLALGLDGVANSPDFHMCEEKRRNPNFILLFHKMSEENWGNIRIPNPDSDWLDGAKRYPTVLFYSLEPIHTLLEKTNPRREGLRQAVSEYVRESALLRKCGQPCPPGSQPSASDFCSCECPNNNFTNSMCCAPKRGLAKLTLTIDRAEGLWGDYITGSDGYVVVSFQGLHMQTGTVWNNNNPTWDVTFDLVVLLDGNSKIQVEVWDEDFGWDDDLLGSCKLDVLPWSDMFKTCYLNHGSLLFKYHLVCGRNLGGITCSDFLI